MDEPSKPGRSGQDLAHFVGQAWAALRSGVVRYSVLIEVSAEGMQSHAQGLLDLRAGRFAQQVRTLILRLPPDGDAEAAAGAGSGTDADVGAQADTAGDLEVVEVDDTTPQYFAGGVLSMPIPQDGGGRRWVRVQGCTVADAGVVPLLWASGAAESTHAETSVETSTDTSTGVGATDGADDLSDGDHVGVDHVGVDSPADRSSWLDQPAEAVNGPGHEGEVLLSRDSVLNASGHDEALGELVGQSVATLGWSDPACRPSARFERLGQWWWARLHLPAARGTDQADLVMTVTFAAAETNTSVPSAPQEGEGVPVITPEVFTRLLAVDWPDDLPFRLPRTGPE